MHEAPRKLEDNKQTGGKHCSLDSCAESRNLCWRGRRSAPPPPATRAAARTPTPPRQQPPSRTVRSLFFFSPSARGGAGQLGAPARLGGASATLGAGVNQSPERPPRGRGEGARGRAGGWGVARAASAARSGRAGEGAGRAAGEQRRPRGWSRRGR